MLRLRAFIVTALLLPAQAAWAADLEVGAGHPYATIQGAVAEAVAGDVILVHAGSYAEELSLAGSGASGSPIRIQPAGDGAVTLTGRISIDGSHWEIADLAIVASAGVDAIQIDGDENWLRGIDLSGGTKDGIDGGGANNRVTGSRIHDFDGGDADAHCIVLNPGATGWRITDNELFDCSGDGVQLYASSAERTIKGTVIEGNAIYWSGAIGRMENAVDVKNADGLRIANNVMSGFVGNKTLVFQKGPANIEVDCNVMSGGFTGVEFRAEDGGTVEGVRFTRNLMHGFSEYALKFDGTVGAEVFSNTFVTIASDGLRIEGLGLTDGVVRNNLWSQTGSVDAGPAGDHNGFFGVSSNGIASPTDVNADPLLDADFRLGAGSPMIDAGVDVGLPFEGSAPDLGAFESGADPCARPAPGGSGSGSGSTSGSGASSGATTGSGAGGSDAGAATGSGAGGSSNPADADEDGGCGCHTPGAPGGAPLGIGALLAAMAIARFARRQRSRAET